MHLAGCQRSNVATTGRVSNVGTSKGRACVLDAGFRIVKVAVCVSFRCVLCFGYTRVHEDGHMRKKDTRVLLLDVQDLVAFKGA